MDWYKNLAVFIRTTAKTQGFFTLPLLSFLPLNTFSSSKRKWGQFEGENPVKQAGLLYEPIKSCNRP